MREVIIICTDHHNGLSVIRALGERGLKPAVILVGSRKNHSFVGKSKYIGTISFVNNTEGIIPTLLAYPRRNEKPVIIACFDGASSILDLNYDVLKDKYELPGSTTQGKITHFMNKQLMGELANECGLKTPKSWLLNKNSSINEISYPCITKPILSKDGAKSDICVCKNKTELEAYLVSSRAEEVQVQEFIEKVYEYQLIGCATEKDVIIPGYSSILRPCKGSNTAHLVYNPMGGGKIERINLQDCEKFVRETGYLGLFSMEFLRDRQGEDYFMEINFRNDGNAICVLEAGINLPYIWYLHKTGQNYYAEMNKQVKTVYVTPELSETKLLFTHQITLKDYFKDMFRTNRFMDFDRKDPLPLFYELLYKVVR